MTTRVVMGAAAAALAFAVAACSSSSPQPEQQAQSQPAAAPAADHGKHPGGGRVFFVTPKNGDTIKPTTKLEFGNESVTISPVPPGELKEARPGMAHYHLGVDADCLPTGTVIPKADPWIHFGTGSNNIEMQLKPGPHKLSVQAADDLHATIQGLCETINVTVAE